MNSLKESFSVKSYDTDHRGLLKTSAFLNLAQEMANNHAHKLGFGYDNLIESGYLWVLSRVHVKFLRVPRWRESLTIETWHKGSDRLFGYRDYSVEDINGEKIILATTSWLVIDSKTRKVQRISNLLGETFDGNSVRHAIEEPAQRLVTPYGAPLTTQRVVSYSDTDINIHTNNARYVEWAMDALPQQLAYNLVPKDLKINFNSESLPGESIDLLTFCCEPLFIEGKRGEKSVFQIEISSDL